VFQAVGTGTGAGEISLFRDRVDSRSIIGSIIFFSVSALKGASGLVGRGNVGNRAGGNWDPGGVLMLLDIAEFGPRSHDANGDFLSPAFG
jgi:hypothetical protein